MKLEQITAGMSLTGAEPTQIVTVVATVPLGDGAVQLIYRTPDGTMKERLLGAPTKSQLSLPQSNARGPSTATARRFSSPAKPSASTSRSCSTR